MNKLTWVRATGPTTFVWKFFCKVLITLSGEPSGGGQAQASALILVHDWTEQTHSGSSASLKLPKFEPALDISCCTKSKITLWSATLLPIAGSAELGLASIRRQSRQARFAPPPWPPP